MKLKHGFFLVLPLVIAGKILAAVSVPVIGPTSPNLVLQTDSLGVISSGTATTTELGYLSGVTGSIQTQLNAVTSPDLAGVTASIGALNGATAALRTDLTTTQGNVTALQTQVNGVTTAIGGITTNIAAQSASISGKVNRAGDTMSGDLGLNGPQATPGRALLLDSQRRISSSSVLTAELGYLSGVTGSIQSQLNAVAAPNLSGITASIGALNGATAALRTDLTTTQGNVTALQTQVNGVTTAIGGITTDIAAQAASISGKVNRAGDTMTGGIGAQALRLPFGTQPGSILWGDDTDSGPYQTGDGELFLASNGFPRFHVSQNYSEFIGPVTVSGDLNIGGNLAAANYPPTGPANNVATYNGSGALSGSSAWTFNQDTGEVVLDKKILSGVTTGGVTHLAIYGGLEAGGVNNDVDSIRVAPTYDAGSNANGHGSYRDYSNYYGTLNYVNTVDSGKTFHSGSVVANGANDFNVHPVWQSGSYAPGYTAFNSSTTIDAGSLLERANGYGSYPQIYNYLINGGSAFEDGATVYAGATTSGLTSGNFHPVFQTGSEVNGYTGVYVRPEYQVGVTANNATGYGFYPNFANQMQYYLGYDEGAVFQDGASMQNITSVNLHPSVGTNAYVQSWTGSNYNPQIQSGGTLEYITGGQFGPSISPAARVRSATGYNVNFSGGSSVQDSATGYAVNMDGVTVANGSPPYTFNGNGGVFNQNYTLNLNQSVGFFQGNYMGGQLVVSAPIANTFGFGGNLATGFDIRANVGDDGQGGIKLGFVSVGFVGSASVLSGITADAITAALAGFGVQPGSTGGLIEHATMYRAAGFLPQGGTLSIGQMEGGFRMDSFACGLVTGDCYGLNIEDPTSINRIASSLTLDGTTANRVAILDGTKTLEASSVTTTELDYLSGATSNIQSQINSISVGNPPLDTYATGDCPGPTDCTITASSRYVMLDGTSGDFQINVPTAVGNSRVLLHLKKQDGTANTITVKSIEDMDDTDTILLNGYDAVNLLSDGTKWNIL